MVSKTNGRQMTLTLW